MIKKILLFIALHFFCMGYTQEKNIVLELFTSQGCSSCPSADKLLKQISESKTYDNVITLAYHVDYWDRLGWKDLFSKQEYTKYQQQYGRKFGGRSIYTPQLVINGSKHIVGSDRSSLESTISRLKDSRLSVPVTITSVLKKGNNIHVSYKSTYATSASLNIVMLLKEKITEVKRGENRNRTLVDTHIVVSKQTIDSTSITEAVFTNVNYSIKDLEFVAYVQNKQLEILGATQWN